MTASHLSLRETKRSTPVVSWKVSKYSMRGGVENIRLICKLEAPDMLDAIVQFQLPDPFAGVAGYTWDSLDTSAVNCEQVSYDCQSDSAARNSEFCGSDTQSSGTAFRCFGECRRALVGTWQEFSSTSVPMSDSLWTSLPPIIGDDGERYEQELTEPECVGATVGFWRRLRLVDVPRLSGIAGWKGDANQRLRSRLGAKNALTLGRFEVDCDSKSLDRNAVEGETIDGATFKGKPRAEHPTKPDSDDRRLVDAVCGARLSE